MKAVLLTMLLLASADPGSGSGLISKKAPPKLKSKAANKPLKKRASKKAVFPRSKSLLSTLGTRRSTKRRKLTLREKLLQRIKRAMPKGWRVQTAGLPEGLEGAAFGPIREGRRPVITVSSLERGAPLSTSEEKAYVLKSLSRDARLSSLNTIEAPRSKLSKGWLEIRAEAPLEATEASEEVENFPQTVRYLIAQGDPTYILTIVSPPSRFENTYNILVRGIQKLSLDPSPRNR